MKVLSLDRWAWRLDGVVGYGTPIPVKGRQGVWEWTP